LVAFDVEFEDEILSQCMRSTEYLRGATATLDSHHFATEQHGWIWKTMKDVWDSHGERLTTRLISHRARGDFKDVDERMAVLELSSKLKRLRPAAPKAALGELGEFVRFVHLQTSMEDAVRHLDKGNIGEAYSAVGKVVSMDSRPNDYEVAHWVEEFVDRLKAAKVRRDNPDAYPVIATGIRGLDKIIGGIRETELGIIAATTNRGKSIMGVHLGFHAIKKNHGVIHFSTEMHKDQVSMRYDSRWSRMVHAKFKTYDFTSAEIKSMAARLKKARMRYDGLLKIVSMPVSSARLAQMKTMVVPANTPGVISGSVIRRKRVHRPAPMPWAASSSAGSTFAIAATTFR